MTYKRITAVEAASRLGIAPRTMRQLCAAGRVVGARRVGIYPAQTWVIPVGPGGRPVMRRSLRGRPPRW